MSVPARAGSHGPRLLVLAVTVLLAVTGCSASGSDARTSSASPSASATTLAAWNRAVAGRADAPARWVAIGDSISEGQGASTRSHRWLDLTLAALRDRHPTSGVTGGAGYLPAAFAVYGPDSDWADWSTSSTGSSAFDTSVPDLGYRAVAMQAGASRTYPFTGTGVDIWWTRYQGSGRFTWSVDGGTPRTVDTDGPASAARVTAVDGLTSGEHTVTITAEGAFDLQGFTVYDGDRHRGVTLLDSTHSGSTVAQFTQERAGFLGAMRRAAPDLVTISLGGNDAKTITAAQLEQRYVAFVEALQALPTKPSVLIIGEYGPGPDLVDAMRDPWTSYRDAERDVAARTGAAYVDIAPSFPVGDGSARPGISTTDDLHPDDSGQRTISRVVLRALRAAE